VCEIGGHNAQVGEKRNVYKNLYGEKKPNKICRFEDLGLDGG
jgi:hypothetical protein